GHMRQMLREMAQWHARGLEEPLERADRARGLFTLLDQLGESSGPSFYVGVASPEGSREPPWSPAVSAFVEEAAGDDRIAREQYFDLLVMRRFRSSLVCHADRAPAPRVDRRAVQGLLVALDGDEAPEAVRAAVTDGPVPFATLQE